VDKAEMVHANENILYPRACSYGWCGTIRNYTNFEEQRIDVEEHDGWGFCQKSCFPSPEEELGGVERVKVRRPIEKKEISFDFRSTWK